jgi:hypothetical protein
MPRGVAQSARIVLTATLAASALLLVPAHPAAAVDVRSDNYFDVIDRAGVQNTVVISQVAPNRIRVTDASGVTSGPPCTAETPQAVVCDLQPVSGASAFALGAGDDSLTVAGFPIAFHASGGLGNDMISGPPTTGAPFGGPSLFLGGPGNDRLVGNIGEDLMRGGDGDDVCLGGPGPDDCGGGAGADSCEMGDGNDSCSGRAGNDLCLGEGGNDRCLGGKGRDRCVGGPGRDFGAGCERRRGIEASKP